YKYWPTAAEQWLQRSTPYGWPTNEIKLLIKNNGCHIVPTGINEIQWRLSFSIAEVTLINTIDNNKKQIYSILKLLIKYICRINNIKSLKSYQLKTIFLWYCEQQQPFQDEQLCLTKKQLILDLLKFTMNFYENKSIPHYFISAYNVLIERTDDEI
ncbi:unnamed protein product, partial [Didymodactylos carnosus]